MFTAEQKQIIHDYANKLDLCKVRERGAIIESLSQIIGVSPKSCRRHLEQVAGWKPSRKKRSDCGKSLVQKDFALLNSGVILKATRETGKGLMSFGQSLDILEANHLMPLNEKTGELTPISTSTLSRRLRDFGLHPKQLKRGNPAIGLRSLHPNHTWEIDASVCVLFYLPDGKMEIIDEAQVYKNKPENEEKVRKAKIIRYVITDHYSGFIYVKYALGNEDAYGVLEVLMSAIENRGMTDPMRGVPYQLLLDKGAGNMSKMVKGFCEKMGITLLAHATGNARAKGQVECANNLVEKGFESRLKFLEINTLEELQAECDKWRTFYNGRNIHTRTGKTRSQVWSGISQENLRICDKETMQEIAVWKDVKRFINGMFCISVATKKWGALSYDLSKLSYHGFNVRDEVSVLISPYHAPNITVSKEIDGQILSFDIAPIQHDEAGFRLDAPIIGEEHKAIKKTRTEILLEEIEKSAYGVETVEEAKEAKAKKVKPYQNIDFMADVNKFKNERIFLSTEGVLVFDKNNNNSLEEKEIDRLIVAQKIRAVHGDLWAKDARNSMQWLKNTYGDRIKESEIEACIFAFYTAFSPKKANISTVFENKREKIWQVQAG